MARVAGPAGQRGRTIPARSEGGSPTRRDARYPASLHERGHWSFGPRQIGRGTTEGSRGRVRRTAAIIAAGALVLLSGCQGKDAGGSSGGATADAAPAAQVTFTVADGTADVSP